MAVTVLRFLNYGDTADVFSLGNACVLKAFRRKAHSVHPVADWDEHDALTRAYFRAEVTTYERLQDLPELSLYVPQYYGHADPLQVLRDVPNVEARYVGGCGILMEKIHGPAVKVSRLEPAIQKEVKTILEEIRDRARAPNVWDSSCFLPGTRSPFTVIDFASWGGSLRYERILETGGTLSEQLRAQLEQEYAFQRERSGR